MRPVWLGRQAGELCRIGKERNVSLSITPASAPLEGETTLAMYFHERLTESSARLRPAPQEDTLWYLGNMLARFGDARQLFSYSDGQQTLRPLALLYSDARAAETRGERFLILRQLGDAALFLGALFPEQYHNKGINKDYLVGMGGGAYASLSQAGYSNPGVFSELASSFTRMLELVAQACCKQSCFDASDIFALYERWKKTNDPLLASQLQALGITANSSHSLQ